MDFLFRIIDGKGAFPDAISLPCKAISAAFLTDSVIGILLKALI